MRVNVDDVAFMDRRFKLLGGRIGATWQEALGRCLPVWALAYQRRSAVMPAGDVDALAERPGFAAAMVEVGLAVEGEEGLYLCGVNDRIEFLLIQDAKRESARAAKLAAAGVEVPRKRPPGRSHGKPDVPREGPPGPSPGTLPQEGPYSPDLTLPLALDICASPPAPRPVREPTSDHHRVIAEFDRRYRDRFGQSATWGAKQAGQVKQLLVKHQSDEVIRRIVILFDSPPAFLLNSPPDFATLVQHFDKLVAPATMANGTRAGPRGSPAVGRVEPPPPEAFRRGDVKL